MRLVNDILRHVVCVVATVVVAMMLTMCSANLEPMSPGIEGDIKGPKPKDIPINRPPKGDDLKRLRPRYGIGLQPSIVCPSDSYFGSIMIAVAEYADVEVYNLATEEVYVESLKVGEYELEYCFEPGVAYRVRLCVDGQYYETEL